MKTSASLGKLFGAEVIVSIYMHHDQILISPKEEELFIRLIEWSKTVRDVREHQELLAESNLKLGGKDE